MVSDSYKNKIKESINNKFSVMGVDEESINELISVSIESLEEELAKVQEVLNSNDISNLGFYTHTIKGILLNVGLDDDANKFKEIKHLFEEGKTDDEIKEITKERISIFY